MPTGPSTTQSSYLVSLRANVRITSILSVGDGAGGHRMAGAPDGLGAFDNGDGTFTVLMNHEFPSSQGVARDHGSIGAFVDVWLIDANTLEVLGGGDLAQTVHTYDATNNHYVHGTVAWNRFCSGDLPAASAFYNAQSGRGTQAHIYLTGEETAAGHAWAFIVSGAHAGQAWELPWMGNLAFENVVANPDSGNKTLVMATNDGSGGQVYLYHGQKHAHGSVIEKAGLTGGTLHGIKVHDLSAETSDTLLPGGKAHFSLKKIGDASGLDTVQLEAASDAAGLTEFFRPEDGAWDPSHPNRFYFVTTTNFDSHSKLWRLDFDDIQHPRAGGTIYMLLDGTEGQKMMDNITVTADGKVIICEDPGASSRLARVWQYDPGSDKLSPLAKHDPDRFETPTAPFTQNEESTGVIDVTAILGDADTYAFLINTQAHYAIADPELIEGGQLMVMYVDHRPGAGPADVAAIMAGLSDPSTVQPAHGAGWHHHAYPGADFIV